MMDDEASVRKEILDLLQDWVQAWEKMSHAMETVWIQQTQQLENEREERESFHEGIEHEMR